MTPIHIIMAGLLLVASTALSQEASNPAVDGAAPCLGCHDYGPESPVHAVLGGSHGTSGAAADMAGRHGCPDCHGASADHIRAPIQNSPTVSFGPRWSATTATQDGQCLACHEATVAAQWRHSLHMFNNLACVTCHAVHAEQDQVMIASAQAEVCTICHKAQKKGIHGLADAASRNPPCTICHNPHDHESARTEMLDNRSAGCRSCHKLTELDLKDGASKRAKRRHKVMTEPDHTCLDCHPGIAHDAADPGPAAEPIPVASKEITLFYPGMADSDWLLQNHPGSQPLRQGRSCQQCHRGEEASMGEAQASNFEPAFRRVRVSFARSDNTLHVSLQWQGPADDTSIALMWGDGGSEAFRLGGCFAACHSDLPGMSQNRGQQTRKYLAASRAQQQRIGQPPLVKAPAELEELLARGEFVELWQVDLISGAVGTAIVLDDVSWQPRSLIQIKRSHKEGRWTVELTRLLTNTEQSQTKSFSPRLKYTFGLALNGAANPGGGHWVSLPLTLSFDGDETDYKLEKK